MGQAQLREPQVTERTRLRIVRPSPAHVAHDRAARGGLHDRKLQARYTCLLQKQAGVIEVWMRVSDCETRVDVRYVLLAGGVRYLMGRDVSYVTADEMRAMGWEVDPEVLP